MVGSEDLRSLKHELAEKMKKLALATEGAPGAFESGKGATSEKASKTRAKGSKVKARGFSSFKKRDEI
jgi:hypothetical protein